MDEFDQIPELAEAQYLTEVMHLGLDKTELLHDCDLLKRAHDHGITATLPAMLDAKRKTSSAMSDSTESTRDQTYSTVSETSITSHLTPHSSIYCASNSNFSSPDEGIHKIVGRNMNFSAFEKYLDQIGAMQEASKEKKAVNNQPPIHSSGQSIFSVSTRKSLSGVTSGFRNKMRLKRRPPRVVEAPVFCVTCHSPFNKAGALHPLPCGHAKCSDCLASLAAHAIQDERKMPPTCCNQPIPAEPLQRALNGEAQETFLKAVVKCSTPSDARVFCCNAACGEFIPPLKKFDSSMPSTVVCLECQTRVCCTCKGDAHTIGVHCPEDWELLDALKIGGTGSWRRCYKCRKLVELVEVSGPATCTCAAQFCHACGGIWDTAFGCPNLCQGNEDVQTRIRDKQVSAPGDVNEAGRLESELRSASHPAMKAMKASQKAEMQRFLTFRQAAENSVAIRHAASEVALANGQLEEMEKVKGDHLRTTSLLEDSQITEELDLRSSLEQAARSIKVRIKHMEAYCDGLGKYPNAPDLPPRRVTEQNLRDLGHQYNLRDDMERQHEAKINMMRDRQAKRMEELVQRHDDEVTSLSEAHQKRRASLREKLFREHDTFSNTFKSRQSRCTARWALALEIQSKDLQEQDGLEYAVLSPPSWPDCVTAS